MLTAYVYTLLALSERSTYNFNNKNLRKSTNVQDAQRDQPTARQTLRRLR